ncbi:MAG: YHYH protein [Planctomycetaceae bacterium]
MMTKPLTGLMLIMLGSADLAMGHDGSDVLLNLLAVISADNDVRVTEADGFRFIEANGLPDHPTGDFPNRHNPNRISEQRYRFRMPLKPVIAEQPTPVRMHPFGVALNGIPFDPGAAEFWRRDPNSGWQYEAMSGAIDLGLDDSHAHVQPNGAYHYHGIPVRLVLKLAEADSMTLVGYGGDGFPVYAVLGYRTPGDRDSGLVKLKSGYQLKSGRRAEGNDGPGGPYDGTFVQDYEFVPDSGDLDECNGRFGVTPEYPDGTYYYVLTDTFPFIPRMLKGTLDASFRRGPPERGQGRPGSPPGPRR